MVSKVQWRSVKLFLSGSYIFQVRFSVTSRLANFWLYLWSGWSCYCWDPWQHRSLQEAVPGWCPRQAQNSVWSSWWKNSAPCWHCWRRWFCSQWDHQSGTWHLLVLNSFYPHYCLWCPEATCQDLPLLLRKCLLMVTVQLAGILCMPPFPDISGHCWSWWLHGSFISLDISSDQILPNNTFLSASQLHDWVFLLLPEMQHKLSTFIVQWFAQILGGLLYAYLCPLSGADSQWVVMAAHHCYSQWRWWSDTLWVTLIRLWLHPLLFHHQIVVVEISLQFHTWTDSF